MLLVVDIDTGLYISEFQEQVRSGDASATGYFELGAVMLRRKFYPAAIKYLLQAIEKWDGDDQDLAQVLHHILFTLITVPFFCLSICFGTWFLETKSISIA